MPSIHKDGDKPHYFCCFYDPEGFRRKRSTGTDNKRIATTICVNVDRASKLAREGKLSNAKGLKLISETCRAIAETHGQLAADQANATLKGFVDEFIRIAGGELTTYTVRSWFESWLASRTDASKATLLEYDRTIKLFLDGLGARANTPLTTLQPRTIELFKAKVALRVAPSTVNKCLKVIKAALNAAVAKRQLEFSPAEHITEVETEDCNRRPFTAAELKALLTAADSEWRTMILIAYYTGLRLRDCATLTWANVDLHTGSLNVLTEKTNRRQVLPIAEPLARHLEGIAGDDPTAPLCPALSQLPASRLSALFHRVMVSAGVVEERGHEKKGAGRDGKREQSSVSFHSLRYNTTSALKSSGVSDSIAMDIVGHETKAVSRNYTKIAEDAKREAINKLPDITK
jgi:integrase